ncbi:MAG: amidohydrolase [Syntrophorhabdus aromaticivorans]|uniref:Amidohydrolase n=1 Tax=Syntrophorhabdus aromaticivorans TaxID=328301 RepID=A0A971S2Y0_9BACT|nr:amidohydrolase [Syntrophorhabdus aromaticivorans]
MKILIQGVLLGGKTQDIFIDNGVVTEISEKCLQKADKIISGKNKAALPAFINGHTHAAMTLFRGYADDMPLKNWLEEKIWPLEAAMTGEDVYWGAKLACLEMIKNGITVFSDMYWHWEATAQAAMEMGMRGFVSAVFIDMFDGRKSSEQIEHNIHLFEIAKKYKPHATFTFGPHAIYTVSRESLEWMREFSAKEDVLIHMHLAETEEETIFSREKYGLSPVEFLDSVGVLGNRFIGCHGCVLDEKDCSILKKRGSNLVHMPVSNLKLAVERMFPYSLVQEKGIPFCFGTDGCASNNHLDLIETMKFASLLAKFSTHDPTMMAAKETFDLATKSAAGIFRLGDWEIEIGNSPDIILVDLVRPELTPDFDLYSNLVYASNGYIVDTVICMGKVLMENRQVPGEEEILRSAAKIAKALVRR